MVMLILAHHTHLQLKQHKETTHSPPRLQHQQEALVVLMGMRQEQQHLQVLDHKAIEICKNC